MPGNKSAARRATRREAENAKIRAEMEQTRRANERISAAYGAACREVARLRAKMGLPLDEE